MSAHDYERLEAAIDHVAARMTQVQDDADLATRIAAVLPERSRFGWLIPQVAFLTAFAVAAIVWVTRETPSPLSPIPVANSALMASLPTVPLVDAPGTALRTLPLERLEPLAPLEPVDVADHERSLPALAVMDALMVSDLTPEALPAAPPLTLAPLGVAALPLTAESFSQKEE